MTADDLYREVILDHTRNPRNKRNIDSANFTVRGNNPSCGDECCLKIKEKNCIIEDIGIDAKGCSISQASASMLAELVKGKSLDEVSALLEKVKAFLKGEGDIPTDDYEDLEALAGVKNFPMRIKCALLAWTTLSQAIEEQKKAAEISKK